MASRRPDTFIPAGSTGAAAHQEATPTTTSDVKTFVVPTNAVAFLISSQTTGCRVTVDGSTPSASNGIAVSAAASPVLIPTAGLGSQGTVKVVSLAAANAVVDVLFLA